MNDLNISGSALSKTICNSHRTSKEHPLDKKSSHTLVILAYSLVCGLLYFTVYSYMVPLWAKEDYAYCYFVPLISAYLIWEKRQELGRIPSLPSWWGMAAILPGIAFYWLGELGGEYFVLYLSSWLVLTGILWLNLGIQKLKLISFPLTFLLTMFPLPNVVYSNVTLKLKLLSSQIGVAMIRLTGLTAFREGNVIDLGFTQLQVIDACSGLRYLIPLFVLGLLLAYYFKAAHWKKVVLVISTIPLTVITNSLRIASVAFLYQLWGASVAEGFFHDFSGWLIFMVSLALLLGEMWILKRIGNDLQPEAIPQPESAVAVNPRSPFVMALVALALLGSTLAITRTIDFREKVPITRPLLHFPMQIGSWHGTRSALDQQILATLNLSDHLLAEYRNPGGKVANLYIAYNESQRKGESSHSPATCLPGSGWIFQESGLVTIRSGDGLIQVRKAFMQKSGDRMLVYYWFPQRGRILTDMVQLKLYAFWDALTKRRTDGALVRMITPLSSGEHPEQAEARLQEFASQAVPVLNNYLPGDK